MENKNITMYLKPDAVWTYYWYNRFRLLEEAVLVSENTQTGYKIYITNEDGGLMFIVEDDKGKEIFLERGLNMVDSEKTFKDLVEDYIEEESVEDVIEMREDDIKNAMHDLLSTLLMDKDCPTVDFEAIYGKNIVDEMVEFVIETLVSEYEAIIYRPTLLEDAETGLSILIEYPYETSKDATEN